MAVITLLTAATLRHESSEIQDLSGMCSGVVM